VILAENLFGRVHVVSSETFTIEAGDLFDGLEAICKIIKIDRLPLLLPFLKSGEVLQRARVIEMAADLEMNFARESLVDFASCLLSGMCSGIGSEGQCLLDGLMQHELEEYKIKLVRASEESKIALMRAPLLETSDILRFLLDTMTPVAESGSCPQKVVIQLNVFGQSHEKDKRQSELHSARHQPRFQHESAGARKIEQAPNPQPTVERVLDAEVQSNQSQETSIHQKSDVPVSKLIPVAVIIQSCQQDIQKVSLQSLSDLVTQFNPKMLKASKSKANLLHLYCAARLWANTDLIQQVTAKCIAGCLKLSDEESVSYENAFSTITEPWKFEYSDREDNRWHEAVPELMQNKILGRIFFRYVLSFIRERQSRMLAMARSTTDGADEMLLLEKDIQQWKVAYINGKDDPGELLEKQFLLKELRIGKRSQEFPTWSGMVYSQTGSASMTQTTVLHLQVLDMMGRVEEVPEKGLLKEKVDLSAHTGLISLPEAMRGFTEMQELTVTSTAMKTLPEWLGELSGLTVLNLSHCTAISALPASIGALTTMHTLNLPGCSVLSALPATIGSMTGLQVLNLSHCTSITALPAAIGALTAMHTLNLSECSNMLALPATIGTMTGLKVLDLSCCGLKILPQSITNLMHLHIPPQHIVREGASAVLEHLSELAAGDLRTLSLKEYSELKELPMWLSRQTGLETLDLRGCTGLMALPVWLEALTALKTLELSGCEAMTALPDSLGALTGLKTLNLNNCDILHTPPPSIVRAGTGAVLHFLRDLAKGEVPSHLIKVVLLGNQRAGKSSLADSLVLGRPVTRADNDRTVGIEVRRWRLGGQSPLVANIYDAAGQRVYRATHGFFMSVGALFLHVVRCDMPEDAVVATLLDWVETVQQEAPGAVMGIVWTHIDCFDDPSAKLTVNPGLFLSSCSVMCPCLSGSCASSRGTL